MKPALAAALATALAAAVPSVRAAETSVKHEPTADFGRFKTFAWADGTPARKPENEKLIHRVVEEQLVARGLVRADEDPDLRVLTHVFIGDKGGVSPTLAGSGYSDEGWESGKWRVGKVPTGTLVIDLLDMREKRQVWRGTAQAVLKKPADSSPEQIEAAIRKLFSDFPPRSEPTATPAPQK